MGERWPTRRQTGVDRQTWLCRRGRPRVLRAAKEEPMILYGMFLLVLATLLNISFLSTIGLIFFIIGIAFSLSRGLGHPVAGRRYWY